MSCCLFKDCFNRSTPLTSITFFRLPKDSSRRQLWLKRSGCEDHVPNTRAVVCEVHFEESDLRRQFHRTTLRADAVPRDYRNRQELLNDRPKNKTDDKCSTDEVYTIVEADYELVVGNKTESANISSESVQNYDYIEIESITESELSENNSPGSSTEVCEESHKRKTHEQCGTIPSLIKDQYTKKIKTADPIIETASSVTSTSGSRIVTAEEEAVPESPVDERVIQSKEKKPTTTADKLSEEEYFALSLVGPLQRLSPEKRAVAKVKILTYLVRLECGIDAEL
ncbi:uncharacterized protein LOC131431010 [Malaya genurostris]|uniref:uncharacterized protein LOC131431010 n=1 Tax=Malaya genurostris TaxID=325434 RepID=UPI0026F3E698|nr:uncharacterized protein LOC131431010 [Malaya genurostris]